MSESHGGQAHSLGAGDGLGPETVDSLRRQLATMERERDAAQEKLQSIAEVIGVQNASRIVHDVRNVMNELVLLRKLSELEE